MGVLESAFHHSGMNEIQLYIQMYFIGYTPSAHTQTVACFLPGAATPYPLFGQS